VSLGVLACFGKCAKVDGHDTSVYAYIAVIELV
jgi:hypothetical protein